MTHTKQAILSAMAQGVSDLLEPTDDVITDDAAANEPKILHSPPLVGSSVTSQALNDWLTQAIHNAPGIDFTTDDLATATRVVGFIRDPVCLRKFLRDQLGINLVPPPIIDLPTNADGKIDNSPAALRDAVLSAALDFYADDLDAAEMRFEDMALALASIYATTDTPRHPMVEVFQYWDLMPVATLFPWVLQYFLCVQSEESVVEQIKAQQAKNKIDAATALELAAKAAVDGGKLATASNVAAVPSTS